MTTNTVVRLISTLKTWSTGTLLPRNCVACGSTDHSLCPPCRLKIVKFTKQQCVGCLKITDNGRTCTSCRRHYAVYQLVSAAHYTDGPVKELLHTFKYTGRLELVRPIVDLLLESEGIQSCLRALDPGSSVLVPVPLHRNRRWKRGFNQSATLAHQLARRFRLPSDDSILQRLRYTKPQFGLSRLQREQNVAEAFRLRLPTTVRGKTVILIDDIVTTGATLNACARLLKSAGATKVIGAVVARA